MKLNLSPLVKAFVALKYLGRLSDPVVADMGILPMKMAQPLGFRLEVPVASS